MRNYTQVRKIADFNLEHTNHARDPFSICCLQAADSVTQTLHTVDRTSGGIVSKMRQF
jgi:hypothetical protein